MGSDVLSQLRKTWHLLTLDKWHQHMLTHQLFKSVVSVSLFKVTSVPLITTRDQAGTSCLNEGPFAKKVHESVIREDVSFYSFFTELVKYAKECNPVLLLGKGTCYGTCLCGWLWCINFFFNSSTSRKNQCSSYHVEPAEKKGHRNSMWFDRSILLCWKARLNLGLYTWDKFLKKLCCCVGGRV